MWIHRHYISAELDGSNVHNIEHVALLCLAWLALDCLALLVLLCLPCFDLRRLALLVLLALRSLACSIRSLWITRAWTCSLALLKKLRDARAMGEVMSDMYDVVRQSCKLSDAVTPKRHFSMETIVGVKFVWSVEEVKLFIVPAHIRCCYMFCHIVDLRNWVSHVQCKSVIVRILKCAWLKGIDPDPAGAPVVLLVGRRSHLQRVKTTCEP